MERNQVTISNDLDVDDRDAPLVEFIALLQAALENVPPEFRAVARYERGEAHEYGYDLVRPAVAYNRMETDEELAARKAYEAEILTERLRRARAEYERLKAMFGE